MEIGRHMRNDNEEEREKEENKDRLSDLPDCLLLHILSFLYAKQAVQTCILSTRWNHLWKHLPTLTLSSDNYNNNINNFTNFVHRILNARDGSTALHSVDISGKGPLVSGEIVEYAVSHNVQRLRLDVTCDIRNILPCIFSSQTLTFLSLSVQPRSEVLFPNSLNLPALTDLYLQFFTFRGNHVDGHAEPFSVFSRLNSLMIGHCNVLGAQTLCISSTTLVNLTIHGGYRPRNYCKIELSAPSLSTFAFIGTPFQKLCCSHLCSVKHVSIDADTVSTMSKSNFAEIPLVLLSWLLELDNVESLTVSATTLQVLSQVPDLLKLKLASLRNLKSLKVNKNRLSFGSSMILRDDKLKIDAAIPCVQRTMFRYYVEKGFKPSSFVPGGIVDFLLQNSPSAEVDIVKDQFDLGSILPRFPTRTDKL